MTISVAGKAIPVASLPDIEIEKRKGESTYRVTVSADAAFASDIIAACTIGATVAIAEGGMTFTGTCTGFGCRPGNSTVQITGATVSH